MEAQSKYREAIKFAALKHQGQKVPGTDLPYVVHLSNVAMEIMIAASHTDSFDLGFAVQLALLHDTLEDTSTEFGELEDLFGIELAEAVSALTKNGDLPKDQQMQDSLNRIKKLRSEVWAVKLADRITNLQPPPPHWDRDKRINYQAQARIILSELGEGNVYLARRLKAMIETYGDYLVAV
jgi:guanosine-3',5'-bis(diphosphate) 3'-pyrophosphohydrolase